MKMKKYISAVIIALTTLTMVSCEKKVDVNAVSATLPGLKLSSLGMSTPGPYSLPTSTTVPNVIQILFGATTTNKSTGVFDVFIYDSAAPTVVVATLHFASWAAVDSFSSVNSFGSIGYTNVPSTYPNTTIYQGSILLKYGSTKGAALLTGKSYNVTATASSSDGIKSTVSVTKLFTIQ